MKKIRKLLGSFTFCCGIGLDQLTPEFKRIYFWETKQIKETEIDNSRHIKPKMSNVKPQPFSLQRKKI
jgi:hypothetical protein